MQEYPGLTVVADPPHGVFTASEHLVEPGRRTASDPRDATCGAWVPGAYA